MKVIHYSFLVVAFVYLVACGGGGGTTTTDAGGNPIRSTNYPNWVVSNPSRAQTIAQGEVLNRTAAEIRSLISSRRSSATRFISSNVLASSINSGFSRLETTCPGSRTCTVSGQQLSFDTVLPSLNLAEIQPLFTRNGIDIGQVRLQFENVPSIGQNRNVLAIGGILDHSFFGIGISGIYQIGQVSSARGNSFSFGSSPGTSPSSTISSATWTGVMLGVDYSQVSQVSTSLDRLQPLHGDARIVVEGLDTTPTVDVTFSNVRNLNTGTPNTLDGWVDIPLSNGFFRTGSGTNKIEGTFYGSEHQEVGGHFEKGRIIGAFGGKRP